MKTAVELFWKEIQDILPSSVDTETGIKLLRAFEQSKEMEEGQMIDFACDVYDLNYCKDKSFRNAAEQCYNEIFKQEEQ
jgi:hypothetical protein